MADVRRHRIDVPESGHRGGNLAPFGEGDDGEGGRRPIAVVVPEASGTQSRIAWKCAPFAELSPREIHDLYQARVGVFVLEQKCAFQDVDGADPECWHLLGRAPSPLGEGRGEGVLLAYARLVPPGLKFPEPSIGRVLTTAPARRSGAGRELMREAVGRVREMWPGRPIRIGAQRYLERFYGEFGFVQVSEPYDEDGIPHIEMLRAAG